MDSLPRPNSSSPRLIPCGGDYRRVWPYFYRPVPQGLLELVDHGISQVPAESFLYPCLGLRPRSGQIGLTLFSGHPVLSPLGAR